MCGIAGYLSNIEDKGNISNMLKAIRHRGPDGEAEYHEGNYHVGMCRLAINGINNGNQPLYNEGKTIIVMYNGEIYNYPKLKEELKTQGYKFKTGSDGEVICHLYERYGKEAFDMLDGMFAIALWDRREKKLILVRDQIGEKPLYYSNINNGKGIIFGSEIKAIREYSDIKVTLNQQAIWDFPTYLWIPEPETIFNEIKILGNGQLIEIKNSGLCRIENYTESNKENKEEDELTDDEAIELTREVVDDSIKSRLLSDVPVGCFLSGGLDSSIVSTITAKEKGKIDTFCIGFEKGDDPYHGKFDESKKAERYAKIIGSRHHTIGASALDFRSRLEDQCRSCDQPFGVSSALGIASIAEYAREQGIKVLLSGDCADEMFGGYSWYNKLKLKKGVARGNKREEVVSMQNTGLDMEKIMSSLERYDSYQRAWAWHYYAHEQEKEKLFSETIRMNKKTSLRFFEMYSEQKDWDEIQYITNDRAFYMKNEMLTKVDRMTMRYSIEGRVPFASTRVKRLAERLDYNQLIRGNELKWALRNAYKDEIPAEILKRPKHGFNVPIDKWLNNEWKELVKRTFSKESKLYKLGIINNKSEKVAEDMLQSKLRLNGHTIYCFIVLNFWLEHNL